MLKSSGHAIYSMQYHLIFVTKYRHPCLNAAMLDRCRDILSTICTDWRCELIEFNGESDHVHALIEGHPSVVMAQLVRTLKTVTARLLRSEYADILRPYYWKPVLWAGSYALFTVGSADVETVKKYIQQQESPV